MTGFEYYLASDSALLLAACLPFLGCAMALLIGPEPEHDDDTEMGHLCPCYEGEF